MADSEVSANHDSKHRNRRRASAPTAGAPALVRGSFLPAHIEVPPKPRTRPSPPRESWAFTGMAQAHAWRVLSAG
ncbi:hypothetical protein [Haladaptatus litoreus]|uniref:hypothetical protein n=1 Tax=Haladaptatus litoreus TaxID=553468 RepID=UPI0011157764|nr:hypothetical protein [Haladaptatus litoreus]